jgi:hypothetical protein
MKKLFLFISVMVVTVTINAQDTLQQYTGKYVFPEGSVVPDVTVALSGKALTMSSVLDSSALTGFGVDSFQIVEFSGIAIFKRGDDKKSKWRSY